MRPGHTTATLYTMHPELLRMAREERRKIQEVPIEDGSDELELGGLDLCCEDYGVGWEKVKPNRALKSKLTCAQSPIKSWAVKTKYADLRPDATEDEDSELRVPSAKMAP